MTDVKKFYQGDDCCASSDTPERRIARALEVAFSYSQIDGAHHKDWAIDQMVRALTGAEIETVKVDGPHSYSYEQQGESQEYADFLVTYRGEYDEEWGCYEYSWNEGTPP